MVSPFFSMKELRGISQCSPFFGVCISIVSPYVFLAWPLPFLLAVSSSESSVRSVKPNPVDSSSSYARISPSRSLWSRLPTLNLEPVLRRADMLSRVWMLDIISVPVASVAPPSILWPLGSRRERFRRYTPANVTRKPQRSESVFTASLVLKPENRMNEAHRVAVVNVT